MALSSAGSGDAMTATERSLRSLSAEMLSRLSARRRAVWSCTAAAKMSCTHQTACHGHCRSLASRSLSYCRTAHSICLHSAVDTLGFVHISAGGAHLLGREGGGALPSGAVGDADTAR